MDLDKHINDYINEEKKITPSPFLQNHIVANLNAERTPQIISLWHSVAVAASVVAVVVSGFLIGSSYNLASKGNDYMVINDSQIENFLILTDDAGE